MALTTKEIQNAYVAFFNRPADVAGLNYWSSYAGSAADLLNTFAQSKEYTDLFSGLNNTQIVNAVYQNLFGRAPEVDGLNYWVKQLDNKVVAIGNVADAINKGAQSTDKTIVDNKVTAATAFTTALDTTAEILAYAGVNATGLAAVKAWLATVTADAATLTAATGTGLTTVLGTVGSNVSTKCETFTLTKGIDNIVGATGNDTINASWSAAADQPFGGLDVIDGAGGTDTLNVADSNTAAGTAFTFGGATIKNVENIAVSTTGQFSGLNVSAIAGLTSFSATSSDTAAATITAAGTMDVALTTATTNNSTVTGGKAVSVTKGASAAGTLGVAGKDLTAVTLKGGAGAVTINNFKTAAGTDDNKGTTLKTVTLDGVDAATGLGGEGLESVTVKGATTAARTVTITNAVVDHALTVNVDGTGYKTDGTAAQTVVVDAAAKTITVNATGSKSSLALTGSAAAKTVNVTGSADLTLLALASATKIDGSAATGGLTLGDLNAATVTISTGAGKDSFAIQATTKVTADAGAGNDTVTLKSALAAGSTLNLGAGDDKLLNSGGSVATSTATAVTVIDAGAGTDTVSASLINAGNAGQFKNFEALDISAAATLDVELMTGSTITGLTLTGSAGAATVSNVATGVGLSVSGDNTGAAHTINVKGAATATDNTFAITFDGAAAATAPSAASIKAGTTVLEGIESISIASAGGANTWNSIALTDAKLKTVTITGDKNLDLTFSGTNGTNTAAGAGGAVSSIDGSAATGKLSIATANVTADDKSGVGLTVKGGSANDTITLAQKATVLAGAGDDSIVVSNSGATVTGGDGKDTIDVSADLYSAAADITTITDFVLGTDKITLNDQGTEVFNATKVDISAATTLETALGIAIGNVNGSTNAQISWFQYGGNTFIVENQTAAATVTNANATDIVVKLTGLIDLSTLTVADFNFA